MLSKTMLTVFYGGAYAWFCVRILTDRSACHQGACLHVLKEKINDEVKNYDNQSFMCTNLAPARR